MKINSTFHVLVFLMAVLTFSTPFVALAQQNPVKAETEAVAEQDAYTMSLQAKANAERDASNDFNLLVWLIAGGAGVTALGVIGLFAGCAFGLRNDPPQDYEIITGGMVLGGLAGCGIGISAPLYAIYKYKAAVPSERLIGKSPEYIEAYTSTYRHKLGLLRATRAGMGVLAIGALNYGLSTVISLID